MDRNLLIKKITENANNYYNGKECVPDEVFDSWIRELKALDPDNEVLKSVGWGYDISTSPMKKFNHLSELHGISNKPRVGLDENLPSGRFKTPKLDGGSVELQYLSGKFIRALTRGNGFEGLDCTSKLQYIVPNNISSEFSGSVVGEYVISDEDARELGIENNQRNIPNGFLGRNNVNKSDCEHFSFIAYKVGCSKYLEFLDRRDILDFLASQGFLVVGYEESEIKYKDAIDKLRLINGKHYLLDGIVSSPFKISCDKDGVINYSDELAYKTINETSEVRVDHVDWNLTRTGKLIPTAILESTYLSGANISRVLAHNAKYVLDNGLGSNSIIKLVRSGEVIPYILEVTSPSGSELPTKCPSCGSDLEWEGVNLVCKNEDCKGKLDSDLYCWIYNLAKVDNLGNSLLSSFLNYFNIFKVEDLYRDLELGEISGIDGVGGSRVKILEDMLNKLRSSHTLQEYLVAMNLKGISWNTANKLSDIELLEKELLSDNPMSAELLRLIKSCRGVNRVACTSLINNWSKIQHRLHNLKISKRANNQNDNANKDLIKVCITGKLSNCTKKEFYSKYSDFIFESDVKNCDYLVCNEDKGSSKLNLAKKLGKVVISEEDLLNIIK